jgi:hypothetical protein
MFVIPGIAAMLAFLYIRPQEVFDSVRPLTFSIVLAVAVLGYVLDLGTRITRLPRVSVLLVVALAFYAWAMLTVAISAPEMINESPLYFVAPGALFLATSLGLQTLHGFGAVSKILLVLTLFMVAVAIHQGLSQRVCIVDGGGNASSLDTEGKLRPCKTRIECAEGGAEGQDYLCEHVGLMGTRSDGGRVRYIGIFQDPNELACAMSISLPFVFIWFGERRSVARRLLTRLAPVAVVIACMVCTVMTQSRSGQISLVATLGVYFVRRFGWRGVGIGGVLALPVLLYGGRSDESSTEERLECWSEAISMWREHPIFGVGAKQFGQHYYLTAHNSALLALAETGPIGLFLWTTTLYIAFKIAIQVQQDFANRPEAESARAAAFAMLAGLVGMVASALFLSLTYHLAFWIEVGLAGTIQAAIWRHDPLWRLRWRWRDLAVVVGLDAGVVIGIVVYLRFKGI